MTKELRETAEWLKGAKHATAELIVAGCLMEGAAETIEKQRRRIDELEAFVAGIAKNCQGILPIAPTISNPVVLYITNREVNGLPKGFKLSLVPDAVVPPCDAYEVCTPEVEARIMGELGIRMVDK